MKIENSSRANSAEYISTDPTEYATMIESTLESTIFWLIPQKRNTVESMFVIA